MSHREWHLTGSVAPAISHTECKRERKYVDNVVPLWAGVDSHGGAVRREEVRSIVTAIRTAISRLTPSGPDSALEEFDRQSQARYRAMLGLDRPLAERRADFDRIAAKAPLGAPRTG